MALRQLPARLRLVHAHSLARCPPRPPNTESAARRHAKPGSSSAATHWLCGAVQAAKTIVHLDARCGVVALDACRIIGAPGFRDANTKLTQSPTFLPEYFSRVPRFDHERRLPPPVGSVRRGSASFSLCDDAAG